MHKCKCIVLHFIYLFLYIVITIKACFLKMSLISNLYLITNLPIPSDIHKVYREVCSYQSIDLYNIYS